MPKTPVTTNLIACSLNTFFMLCLLFVNSRDAFAQCNTTLHKLVPETAINNDDRFGSALAANSQYMVVAAENSDTLGVLYGGAAFVYEKTVAGWAYRAMLTATDPEAYDFFGNAVAIDATGNTIVVINRRYSQGAAYIFEKPASGWTTMKETYKIKFPEYLEFNSEMDISDDGAVIAVSNPMSRNGQVYALQKPSEGWSNALIPETLISGDENMVGNDVLVEGDYIYASAEGTESSIHVYKRNGASYSLIARLSPSEDAYFFGYHLTMVNNTLAASGYAYPASGNGYFAVFLFTRVGEWTNMTSTTEFPYPPQDLLNLRFPIEFVSPTELVTAALVKDGDYYNGKLLQLSTTDGTWKDLTSSVMFEETKHSTRTEFGNQLVWNGTDFMMAAVRKGSDTSHAFRNAVLSLTRSGGIWGSLQKVSLPRNSSSNVFFGTSIVKTTEVMFAGAPYDGTVGRGAGAVYVYDRVGEEFEKIHTIFPPPRNARPSGSDLGFGYSIAAFGDDLAIGAPSYQYAPNTFGKIFLYRRQTSDWKSAIVYDSLIVPAELKLNHVGAAIAMNDKVLFASAYNNLGNAHTNAVVVFERINNKWQYRQMISLGKPFDKSWPSVKFSLSGDELAVGEYYTLNGGVSILRKDSQTGEWTISMAIAGDFLSGFGGVVKLQENHLFVGAPSFNFNNVDKSGAVYVFTKLPGTSWRSDMQPSAVIAPEVPIEGGYFGSSLDVIGNTLAVGAPGMFLTVDSKVRTVPGNTYIIQASDYYWQNTTQYLNLQGDRYDENERDHFGSHVTLDQEYFYIGARSEHTSTGQFSGAVYYIPTPPVIFLEAPLCSGGQPVQLKGYPYGGVWSGPGVTATGTFDTALSGVGVFQLNYTTPNCAYVGTVEIEVKPPLNVEQLSPSEAFICNEGSTTLKIKPIPDADYHWYYRQGNSGPFALLAKDDDSFLVTNPGEYRVAVTAACTAESAVFRVAIENAEVKLGPQAVVCDLSKPVALQASGHAGVWEGTGVTNNTFVGQGLDNGYHPISYRITTSLGCNVLLRDSIKVNVVPPLTLMQSPGDFCKTGSAMLISAPAVSGLQYRWYYKQSETSQMNAINQSLANHAEVFNHGYYQASATNGECTNSSNIIQVGFINDLTYTMTPPENADLQKCNISEVPLNVTAREGTAFTWLHKSEDGDTFEVMAGEHDSELLATESGAYAVRGEFGFCSFESAPVSVHLVRDHFSIPNVFTPNGDDKNALFKAITNSAISRFSIFTRDGSLVYSNNTGEWDGGQAPSGVYYWYVTYQGCDDELHEAKGWVHLLR